MYKICYDTLNQNNKVETKIMATAADFETANQLLREYESQETNLEFYLVKEERK